MTPIERMAAAAWNLYHPMSKPWEKVPEAIRAGKIQQMKAALLALAECELPEDAVEAGALAMIDNDGVWSEDAKVCFPAIIRSIASEGGDDVAS